MAEKKTILVVDDDPVMLASVSDILKISGYALLTAVNGAQALQVMQHQTPDLIVADIMMPEMDGYQFCRAARENPAWRAIPFVFLTARGERDDMRRGYGLGADHYMTKPFEPEDLLLVVETRLQRLAEVRETTRKEIEETKSKLLAALGDDLNGPLSFIYDYISLLQESRRSLSDETTEEILGQMRRGVDEIVEVVEDLMTIVYIDSGAAEIEIERNREHVEIAFALQAVMKKLNGKAEQHGVTISSLIPTDLPVFGISAYVQDIYQRVIDYSIKSARPVDGHVWIRVERRDEQAVASIRHDGTILEPENLARLFVPFYESDQDSLHERSVHCGLVIAEKLARLHGGSITVQSEPVEGTTFTISLPV
ncbi:MAG: hybrid sensor histidine kinase/response regulator [Anaerolineae bacterium]|nr:hybrid sensor histidine kinase/response regulator [Anaerolineae bacterium]